MKEAIKARLLIVQERNLNLNSESEIQDSIPSQRDCIYQVYSIIIALKVIMFEKNYVKNNIYDPKRN